MSWHSILDNGAPQPKCKFQRNKVTSFSLEAESALPMSPCPKSNLHTSECFQFGIFVHSRRFTYPKTLECYLTILFMCLCYNWKTYELTGINELTIRCFKIYVYPAQISFLMNCCSYLCLFKPIFSTTLKSEM